MKLYIYCAGAFGGEMMDVASRSNSFLSRWTSVEFVDDIFDGDNRYGAPVRRLDELNNQDEFEEREFVIATGEPSSRRKIAHSLISRDLSLGRLIDPSSIVSGSATICDGVLVAPFCSISTNAVLEENSCINTMSIVGHDVIIGSHSVISSMVNLGGRCIVGKESYIGMGALVKERVKIGSNSIVGMGSVVYEDIPDGVIALGNPARVVRENRDQKIFK